MAHKSKGNLDAEDVSILRTPIQLQGKTVEQILNGIHYGTPELQSLLLDECDIIFECKVCRALFRDLPNLIAHKRRYCSKSATENNHIAISKIPDEKVYVVQPEAPQASKSNVTRVTRKSKLSLDETISRLQSGELGHSHAYKVYSDAADKLQQQKEEMKVATIRTRTIPTNSNAVFIDVNMASVNIHERSAASRSTSSSFSTAQGHSVITRKAREKVNIHKNKSPSKKARERILRKDCKNSEELQKILLKELKEIQHKVKQRTQANNSLKQSGVKGYSAKEKIADPENVTSSSINVFKQKDNGSEFEDTGLIKKPRKKSTTPKADTVTDCNTSNIKTANVLLKEKTSRVLSAGYDISLEIKSKSSKATNKLRRKSLICQKCHKIFSSKQSLSFHDKIIHSPKKTFFPCLYCPSIFYYFYGVTRHLKLSHSKTKSEINALRKQLRAKAYSKVLPEVDESNVKMRATGLRKGLRNKQEAFSSETSPGSSFVLHSVKKTGKKLSAKKDALSSEVQDAAMSNESRSGNDKARHVNIGSDSHAKSPAVKKEIKRPSNKRSHVSSPHSIRSLMKTARHRKLENDSKKSTVALTKSSPMKKSLVHSCKKCHRAFGRILTYKNHTKVCQGKASSLACGKRRGRSCKNLLHQDSHNRAALSSRSQKEALSLRGRKVIRSENKTPLASFKTSILSKITPPSSYPTAESECMSRQLKSEANVNHESSNTSFHLKGSKVRSSLMPRSTSKSNGLMASVKSERRESRTPERHVIRNQESQIKYEEKSIKGPSHDIVNPVTLKNEKRDSYMDVSHSATSLSPKTTIAQNDTSQSTQITTNSSQMQRDATTVLEASNTDIVALTSEEMKGPVVPGSENLMSKLMSVTPDRSKDHRSNSAERDVRGKISHLVPRSSGEEISLSNKDLNTYKPSVALITDRPRRKRKVPTRNMDAVEMLSKIHNPEKDDPPSKKRIKCQEVGLITGKVSKGRSLVNSKQTGEVKSQTPEVEVQREPKDEMEDKVDDIREGRLTNGRSRIFVLGRSKSRGRKLLCSYDNARVDKLIDVQNSKCLVCGEYCSRIFNLRRHVIRIHLQWSRYQCMLCRFASFDRSECTTHIIRNHRRTINIEDSQAVNSCIADLAKQGSQAMTKKKNQTLRDKKSRQQNKESNIYARPNVRKMPRLAERTLIQERGQSSDSSSSSSPQYKPKSDDNGPTLVNTKTLRLVRMADTVTKDVSENCNPLKKPSHPFNISTRNSPRMFDTRPYKSQENLSSGTQREIVVLQTRKGSYTKTVPLISSKEKSDAEVIFESDNLAEQKEDNMDVKEKSTVKMEIKNEINSPPNHKSFDKMGVVDIPEKNDGESETDENKIKGIKLAARVLSSEDLQGEVTLKVNSKGCDDNETRLTHIDGENCVTNISPLKFVHASDESLSHPSSSSATAPCEPEVQSLKENDKDFHVSSIAVSNPSVSPHMIQISPSYVIIKSARLPPTSCGGTSSSTAVKALNFSNSVASSLSVSTPSADSTSIPNPAEVTQTKTTLLDDIGQEN